MKYRLKSGQWGGTFEKCEALSNRPNQQDVYSPNGEEGNYPQFLESQITNTDLFEPIPERIELEFLDIHRLSINLKDGSSFSDEDLKLMEQAKNGELFTKEDMMEIFKGKGMQDQESFFDAEMHFDDWLKDKQSE